MAYKWECAKWDQDQDSGAKVGPKSKKEE